MEEKIFDQIREVFYDRYGPEPPIPCVTRLEDELALLEDESVLGELYLVQVMRDAARREDCEVDAALSWGTSLVRWLYYSSRINPLPPHYHCSHCGRTEFHNEAKDCMDLPEKLCCGKPMQRLGHRIPLESMKTSVKARELYLWMPESLAVSALRTLYQYYDERGVYRPVLLPPDEEFPELRFALVPVPDETIDSEELSMCELGPDAFSDGRKYRKVIFSFGDKKELLKKLREADGFSPTLEDLLQPAVLAEAKREIERDIRESRLPMPRVDELSFSALLALRGYERSSYSGDNPVLCKDHFSCGELFTSREEVWEAVAEKNKPETFGSSFAARITEMTRRGRYTYSRMDEETERLLKELGVKDYWITQMKYTCYLPPKAELVVSLLDELELAWYRLR